MEPGAAQQPHHQTSVSARSPWVWAIPPNANVTAHGDCLQRGHYGMWQHKLELETKVQQLAPGHQAVEGRVFQTAFKSAPPAGDIFSPSFVHCSWKWHTDVKTIPVGSEYSSK